jgi:class 3 adenylate cyclase
LISEGTASKLGGEFDLEELPAAQVKGKAQPIPVFELLGPVDRGE